MRENQNWTSALIFSALFHIVTFICLSGLVTWEANQPQEEILEMALIDDLGSFGGKGSDASKGTGDSGADNSFLPSQPKQEEVSPVQPPITPQYTPPKPKRTEPTQPKQPTIEPPIEPSIEPSIEPPVVPKTPATEAAAASRVVNSATSSKSSGTPDNGSGTAGSLGSATSGVGTRSGSGSDTTGSGRGGGISPPAVLSSVKPPYPQGARQKGIEGIVELRLLILETGRAADASIISSSGDASLDAAALASINKWRFIPAKDLATGRALARYTRVSVSFELR